MLDKYASLMIILRALEGYRLACRKLKTSVIVEIKLHVRAYVHTHYDICFRSWTRTTPHATQRLASPLFSLVFKTMLGWCLLVSYIDCSKVIALPTYIHRRGIEPSLEERSCTCGFVCSGTVDKLSIFVALN